MGEAPPLGDDTSAVIDEVEAALDEASALAIQDAFVDEDLLEASDEQRPFSSWIESEWTGPQYDPTPLLEPASLEPYAYMVFARAPELHLAAESAARNAALWRGMPFAEPVKIWWNFVAHREQTIRSALEDWNAGRRFLRVPGYDGAPLDAPDWPRNGRLK